MQLLRCPWTLIEMTSDEFIERWLVKWTYDTPEGSKVSHTSHHATSEGATQKMILLLASGMPAYIKGPYCEPIPF